MDIYIQNQIGTCQEFMMNGEEHEVSVVISPLKVTEEGKTIKVSNGCNMWKACQNPRCQFSIVAHGGERKKNGTA